MSYPPLHLSVMPFSITLIVHKANIILQRVFVAGSSERLYCLEMMLPNEKFAELVKGVSLCHSSATVYHIMLRCF